VIFWLAPFQASIPAVPEHLAVPNVPAFNLAFNLTFNPTLGSCNTFMLTGEWQGAQREMPRTRQDVGDKTQLPRARQGCARLIFRADPQEPSEAFPNTEPALSVFTQICCLPWS